MEGFALAPAAVPPRGIPQVTGDHAQPQPHRVRPKAMAAQPRHFHNLLAFLDRRRGDLRRSSLVVELHHSPAGQAQVRDDNLFDIQHTGPVRGFKNSNPA